MSYSFSVRAPSKAAAKVAVAAEMAKTVNGQLCHARDMVPAIKAADAFIDLLADDESKDVVVNMNGSLTGQWTCSDVTLCLGANLSVSAGLSEKVKAAS